MDRKKKKARVAIFISDKIDFKTKTIKRDTEGHFIILKGRFHQEEINTGNIYAPNTAAPKYIRKILSIFMRTFFHGGLHERNRQQHTSTRGI